MSGRHLPGDIALATLIALSFLLPSPTASPAAKSRTVPETTPTTLADAGIPQMRAGAGGVRLS